jgi:peptidoglycan/LPS O-acetylase OafA/YrhL
VRLAAPIPSLDGLRAVSILIVFLAHTGLKGIVPGFFGVTVFFFLSGYLITTLLRIEFEDSGSIGLGDFYVRRVFRIWPLFYLVLVVATLLSWLGVYGPRSPLDPGLVLMQFAHLANYAIVQSGWVDGRGAGTWVYWSLAVEEHFYLLLPVAYLAMLKARMRPSRQAAIFLGLCALALLWRIVLVFAFDAPKERIYVATDTRLDSILFGCVLAIVYNPVLDAPPCDESLLKRVWAPLGAVLLLLSFLPRQQWFDQTFRYTLQGLGLLPIFLVAVRYPQWLPCRALNLPWVRTLGVLSYAIYLVHTVVIGLVEMWIASPAALTVVSGAAPLLVAWLLHRSVELPFIRLRKRLPTIGRASGRPAAASLVGIVPSGTHPLALASLQEARVQGQLGQDVERNAQQLADRHDVPAKAGPGDRDRDREHRELEKGKP